MSSVVVIGAGLGGLAAASRLAARGWTVDLFDRQPGPGGKASSETWDGFRFDTGPSLFTLKSVFSELFDFCGSNLDEHLKLTALDPI